MKVRNISGVILVIFLLTSCDAYLTLSYAVKNKTDEKVYIKIKNYSPHALGFPSANDTIVGIEPDTYFIVGRKQDIGFPWERRKIYREQPGMENFQTVEGNSLIAPDSLTRWKYIGGLSVYKIR